MGWPMRPRLGALTGGVLMSLKCLKVSFRCYCVRQFLQCGPANAKARSQNFLRFRTCCYDSCLQSGDCSMWLLLCVACGCDEVGREVDDCDNSGQCICKHSFTGRTCDRCAAGFYRYPECIGALARSVTYLLFLSSRFVGLLDCLSRVPSPDARQSITFWR